MRYGKLLCLCLLGWCLCADALGRAAARLAVNGHVTVEAPGQLPPGLVARLYLPKEAGRPPLVTRVDERGNFSFGDLSAGRYLLELYDGTQLLHQQVLTLPDEQRVAVRLRARR